MNDPGTKFKPIIADIADRWRRSQRATGWLMGAVALLCAVHLWSCGQTKVGIDFYQFWAVGQALGTGDGTVNIYTDPTRRDAGRFMGQKGLAIAGAIRHRTVARIRPVLETYSTPFLYTILGLFRAQNYETAYQSYLLCCILCHIATVLGLCMLVGFSKIHATIALAILTVAFEPLSADFRVLNVNQIQLAMIALFIWCQHHVGEPVRDAAGGFILALLVMFKPNTGFAVVLLLLYRMAAPGRLALTAAGLTVGVMVSFGWSWGFFGYPGCWVDWFHAIRMLPDDIITLPMGNFSLVRIVMELTGSPVDLLFPVLLTALVSGIVWRYHRPVETTDRHPEEAQSKLWRNDARVVAVGCMVYLLSAPLVWLHYFLLAIPGILLVIHAAWFRPWPAKPTRSVFRFFSVAGAAMFLSVQWFTPRAVYPHTGLVALLLCSGTAIFLGLTLSDPGHETVHRNGHEGK